MATLQGSKSAPNLGEAVELAVSSGEASAIAEVSLQILRELETADDPASLSALLASLFTDKKPSTVAVFLHVFAAADALHSAKAVRSLRGLAIDPAALLEYLDPERVVELGLADAISARKRYQRIIALETRTLTFDLNRDCPYGYAKLAVLLNRASRIDEELWNKVLELMGVYTLEPFRVLCMVIDLLVIDGEKLNADSLEWLANSEYRNHRDLSVVLGMYLNEPLGVQLAARLTVLGAVSFESMFVYFDPKLQGFAEYQRQIKREQEAATQSGMNALAMAELLDDDDDDEAILSEEMQLNEDADVIESGTDLRLSEEPDQADDDDKLHTALLYLGEIFLWSSPDDVDTAAAQTALRYVNAYPLIAGSSHAITKGLCRMVCRKLERGPRTRDSLLDLASKYLVHITHDLSEEVWTAINGIAIADFTKDPAFWTLFFRQYMLPSLDFEPTTDSLLWQFDEQQRFELYNDLQNRVAKENFFVKTRFAKADKDTKNILKRLTKSDAQEIIVPALLEIFSQCPLPSLAVFVNQVESYNIGSLVARSTSTRIPALAMDMLPLIIMQQLTTGGRLAQQQDGLYESRWFRLLASFAGEIATQHTEFDFICLIGLVLRQIGEGDYTQVIVLQQLLLRLSGIPLKSSLSIPQIVALSSAPAVRELTEAALTEQTNPTRERLVQSLLKQGLLLEIYVALCHAYNHMLLEGTNAKVIVNRRDLVAELIVVYAELIGEFGQFDLIELCTEYAVPLPFALILWRLGNKELGTMAAVHDLPGYEEWSGKVPASLYLHFWHMGTYDIVYDEKLYVIIGGMRDPKFMEKSSLSHKLRIKSMKQKLNTIKDSWFSGPEQWSADGFVNFLIIPRLLISPVDAVYASRFLQLMQELEPSGFSINETGDFLFSRGVVLPLLHTASPLELESFATFTTDLFEHLLSQNNDISAYAGWISSVTNALLEVAVPSQSYVPLSNVFSFLQKTSSVFPVTATDGNDLLKRIHLLTISLSDGDLETSVKSLHAQLTKRRSLWIQTGDMNNVHATEFFKTMHRNCERLEARLVASLQALGNDESNEEKPQLESKRPKRRVNAEKKDKRGNKRAPGDDLLPDIGKKDFRTEPRPPTKRLEDDRPQRAWGPKKDRGGRRRR